MIQLLSSFADLRVSALMVAALLIFLGPAGAEASPGVQAVSGLGITQTSSAGPSAARVQTATAAWSTPPTPTPTPLPPLDQPRIRGVRADIGFRLQGGLTAGVLVTSGASVALTGVAIWRRFRAEIGGRYRLPRAAPFPKTSGIAARLSIFELEGRGCGVLNFGRLTTPMCLGLSAGRWSADPVGNTPASPTAELFVGTHILMSARYEVDPHLALWVGAQGTIGLVMPQIRLDEEFTTAVDPLTPRRFGTALEIGVEVKLF